MKTFERNIINCYGEIGKTWLKSLPTLVEKLSEHWQLSGIMPVENMSWNYVALATKNNNLPIVLKISCDKELIQDEYNALKHFDGNGAINAIDINAEYNALLLEQAKPGSLLKEHHPLKIEDTINIYAHIVKMISTPELSDTNYTHVRVWCDVIDKINDPRIARHFIEKAKQLRSKLFNTAQREYLCHGDLHLENIIRQGFTWVAIDPKGIIGEMAFEASAFDLIDKDEMKDAATIPSKLVDRITQLSKALGINADRLLSWIFLRIIISAQWFVEDNGDPNQMLVLANNVYPLLDSRVDSSPSDAALSFMPLQKQHLPLLHQWFQEQAVKKWYARNQEFNLEDIHQKYLPRIEGKDEVPSYLIKLNNKLVGFIQYYSLNNHLPEGIPSFSNDLFKTMTSEKICGIDLFIADSNYRNLGLGSKIINQFITTFLALKFDLIVADPDIENQAAIRCYEKCGFQSTKYSESNRNIIMIRVLKSHIYNIS